MVDKAASVRFDDEDGVGDGYGDVDRGEENSGL
jgi:hypothetical protein